MSPPLSRPTQNELPEQLMPCMTHSEFTFTSCHADVPPAGSVETSSGPLKPPATHNEIVGQETDSIVPIPLPGGRTICQEDAPAVGSVETRRSPLPPPATHSDADGHEIAIRLGKIP